MNQQATTSMQAQEFIAENEAARYLGIDVGTLRTWTEIGFIRQAAIEPVSRYQKSDVFALQKRLMSC